MKQALTALLVVLAADGAHAAVVADSLPYGSTPDWSDIAFFGTSMDLIGGETVMTTDTSRGVWFGWLASVNPPSWSIADNSTGNYLSLTARFSSDADDWSAYMSDGTRYAEMLFNPTGCNPSISICYGLPSTPGVNLIFAGDLPNTTSTQFVALDTTIHNSFEWLLLDSTVTYRVNGVAYSGTALTTAYERLLIIGDSSGSSPSGVGTMRVSGVSFNAGPAFNALPSLVPEPENWAMLIAGLGLVGAALRRRRALFA